MKKIGQKLYRSFNYTEAALLLFSPAFHLFLSLYRKKKNTCPFVNV